MKVLVTGATGFLGAHLVRELIRKGHTVRILRRPSSSLEMLADLPMEISWGDVTNRITVFHATAGCDAIIHAASQISYRPEDGISMWQTNVRGTRNILDAAFAHDIKRFVYVSSVVAVGLSENGQPVNESQSYNLSPYKITYCDTKHLAETEVRKASKNGLSTVVVNPGAIFGDGDVHRTTGGLIFYVANGGRYYVPGGVGAVAVDDVATATVRCLDIGNAGERFILVSENKSYQELSIIAAKHLHKHPPTKPLNPAVLKMAAQFSYLWSRISRKPAGVTREMAKFACMPLYFSNEKAKTRLNMTFQPIEEAIARQIEWYKQAKVL